MFPFCLVNCSAAGCLLLRRKKAIKSARSPFFFSPRPRFAYFFDEHIGWDEIGKTRREREIYDSFHDQIFQLFSIIIRAGWIVLRYCIRNALSVNREKLFSLVSCPHRGRFQSFSLPIMSFFQFLDEQWGSRVGGNYCRSDHPFPLSLPALRF